MLFVSLKKIMISFLFLQPRDFFNNIFNTKITEVKKTKKNPGKQKILLNIFLFVWPSWLFKGRRSLHCQHLHVVY